MLVHNLGRNRITVAAICFLASIIGSALLPESIQAGNGNASPRIKCKEDENDASKCSAKSVNDCPFPPPITTGIVFFCTDYHIPKVCKDVEFDSTCTVYFDLYSCGDKRDSHNLQLVRDENGNVVKCNQYPKDCQ